jgi:hypothetical protein
MTGRTFVISYRDPETGGERTAYVDAADWAEAHAQVEMIAMGEVTGELVDAGWIERGPLAVGRA